VIAQHHHNPKHFLPLLTTTSMTTMLPWNPFLVCEIEVSRNGGPGSCCGMTKKGHPCKNSIKVEDIKIGHQRLTTLAREPFDLSSLQPKLCDVARDFLCARWHRQRQADQVGQQWYEAAVTRREYHMAPEWLLHQSLYIPASVRHRQPPGAALHQTTLTRHLAGSDKTRRCACQQTPGQCSHSIHL
jgi:hypothetical protein